MPTIGLAMIVKDEAHVIVRCLTSVLPLADYILIVDTGSHDGTQDRVRRFLREQGVPGAVVEEPWRNFAYNRSATLALLRQHSGIDYALMIDADEVLVYDEGFDATAFKSGLRADLYDIKTLMGDTAYFRPQLSANHKPFRYRGVLHEFLECAEPFTREAAQGLVNKPIQDSARNRNPRKYLDDAAALEKALTTETDPFLVARYTFYMAQSYRDAGEAEKALAAYRRRASMGFWDQEIYVSLLGAARLEEQMGRPFEKTLAAYLAAHQALPARLEALHGAARLCRRHGRHHQAYSLARRGLAIVPQAAGLFIEQWVADYALLDELAIAAHGAGHYAESVEACARLLADPRTPPDQRQRIEGNLALGLARIGQPSASIGQPSASGTGPERPAP